MSDSTQSSHGGEAQHASNPTYIKIALLLGFITALEVWLYYLPSMASVAVPLYVMLSLLKFMLVVLFFMHLKYDAKVYSWMFGAPALIAISIFTVVLFVFSYVRATLPK